MIYDKEVEKSCIYNMIASENDLNYGLTHLIDDDFFELDNKIIFKVIKDLSNKNVKVDFVSILDPLSPYPEIKGYKIIEYQQSIGYKPGRIESYVNKLHNARFMRNVESAVNQSKDMIDSGDTPIEEMKESIPRIMFNAVSLNSISEYGSLKNSVENNMKEIKKGPSADRGIKTKFVDLDRYIIGLKKGKLITIAARPAMGKTAFGMEIIYNIAKQCIPCGVFSLEMEKEDLSYRKLSSMSGVQLHKIQTGILDEKEMVKLKESMDELSTYPVFIDDSYSNDFETLVSKIKLMKNRERIEIVMIDHLGLISYKGTTNLNEHLRIKHITTNLKLLSKELQIPIILLCQLNRNVEGRAQKIPFLSDLKESGSIEENSDIVAMLYREGYYEPESPNKDILDIFIRKHRQGPVGNIKLLWTQSNMRFMNLQSHGESF
jgi:replicative DNA helicase